ncbi:DMP19 family protein [Limnoglobus roseus]|uniref:DNA mimic protein DMP19 C-terminal domain-containing protein n=1 Tax=Limnoglobus roseus TaxID=2598579 RepID=A0A5C1A9H4_9BACT|nr:DUF4375 domain-containing protein [Limnoglobus roseus]QEL14877.1 hypothetical protein PX52LOC_01776 [Limnoglobus roseus]
MADGERPGKRYWSVVKPIWGAISICDGPDEFLQQFRLVPPATGHLFAAHWCQSEVRNGGLRQFFSNSTGVLAPEALVGFRAIGLAEWYDVLAEAMRFFGNPYPRNQSIRRRLLADYDRLQEKAEYPFSTLDDRFDAWLHSEPDRWERVADGFADGQQS